MNKFLYTIVACIAIYTGTAKAVDPDLAIDNYASLSTTYSSYAHWSYVKYAIGYTNITTKAADETFLTNNGTTWFDVAGTLTRSDDYKWSPYYYGTAYDHIASTYYGISTQIGGFVHTLADPGWSGQHSNADSYVNLSVGAWDDQTGNFQDFFDGSTINTAVDTRIGAGAPKYWNHLRSIGSTRPVYADFIHFGNFGDAEAWFYWATSHKGCYRANEGDDDDEVMCAIALITGGAANIQYDNAVYATSMPGWFTSFQDLGGMIGDAGLHYDAGGDSYIDAYFDYDLYTVCQISVSVMNGYYGVQYDYLPK